MFQSWCDLTFLHWRYPLETVQHLVPQPLQVETFDGSAWVGVTPFILRGLRPVFGPTLPYISTFPETNCRTYVRAPDGSSGVWFFSLEAARAAAVAGARLTFGLPYCWARMRVAKSGRRVTYESTRLWPDCLGRTAVEVVPGESIQARDLENFLTARFRLYSFLRSRLCFADVEHAPWPLHSVEVFHAGQTLTAAAGLPEPQGPPLAHFSPGVRVRIAAPQPL